MESIKKCHRYKDLFRLQSSIYLPSHELQGCYSKPAKIGKAVSLPNIQLKCVLECVDNVWNVNRERGKERKVKVLPPPNIKIKDGP